MTKKGGNIETLDLKRSRELLETHWQAVVAEASAKPEENTSAQHSFKRLVSIWINGTLNHLTVKPGRVFWRTCKRGGLGTVVDGLRLLGHLVGSERTVVCKILAGFGLDTFIKF